MTKKDYIRAAEIVRKLPRHAATLRTTAMQCENAFVEFFRGDNPSFDEVRFRAACQPRSARATEHAPANANAKPRAKALRAEDFNK